MHVWRPTALTPAIRLTAGLVTWRSPWEAGAKPWAVYSVCNETDALEYICYLLVYTFYVCLCINWWFGGVMNDNGQRWRLHIYSSSKATEMLSVSNHPTECLNVGQSSIHLIIHLHWIVSNIITNSFQQMFSWYFCTGHDSWCFKSQLLLAPWIPKHNWLVLAASVVPQGEDPGLPNRPAVQARRAWGPRATRLDADAAVASEWSPATTRWGPLVS